MSVWAERPVVGEILRATGSAYPLAGLGKRNEHPNGSGFRSGVAGPGRYCASARPRIRCGKMTKEGVA